MTYAQGMCFKQEIYIEKNCLTLLYISFKWYKQYNVQYMLFFIYGAYKVVLAQLCKSDVSPTNHDCFK